jgi:6-pyruvoyltetrahydropterin/6-carboxytetrahydropterin synthase
MEPRTDTVRRMTIMRHYDFEAAHSLPLTPVGHKCRTLHGHSYALDVEVTGPVQTEGPESGMVVDFEVIDAAWRDLKERVDHVTLNGVHENPTVENLAPLFWEHFATHLAAAAATRGTAWHVILWLHEGPRTTAMYPPRTA